MRAPRAVLTGLIWPVLVCGAVAALTGCTADDATGTGAVRPGGLVNGWSLALGDCVDVWNGSLVDGVSVTPCSEPHDWEVYHRLGLDALTASGFPGDDLITAAAEEECGAQFLPFLGVHDESGVLSAQAAEATAAFGYTYLSPHETDWRWLTKHDATCLIGDMNGQVTGSLVGAGSPTSTATGAATSTSTSTSTSTAPGVG